MYNQRPTDPLVFGGLKIFANIDSINKVTIICILFHSVTGVLDTHTCRAKIHKFRRIKINHKSHSYLSLMSDCLTEGSRDKIEHGWLEQSCFWLAA